ncbi:EamA family transporter [Mesorhizobium sp. B4-1-1]|uniref:DMT family transporter n=1 Tax=Mesorhizobium sp. B4-1-1 TaxID=2589890 RepID=UPI00112D8786|nr:EamA family transporter [Mesorhizobium sp. B4-1-1]TPI18361.1 EamA family transporter [Mesorhizobium sp. B4-1-1]
MHNLILFGLMALIWGLTWAAIKFGLDAGAPPILLAGLRYMLTAFILLPIIRELRSAFSEGRSGRIIASALLTNAGTYGLLFWGMQTVPSGLSGLVNLSLIPVLLFALAVLVGEDRPTWRHGLALGVGCAGLVGLFWSRLAEQDAGNGMGLAAIVAGTCCYCIGSVIARPLVGSVKPLTLTMLHAIIGGAALMAISFAAGEIQPRALNSLASWTVAGSLLYLSVLGTIVAYTLYLRLLEAWGTARAGLYAFISPIIALAAGAWLFGETIGVAEIGGTVLLLTAAGIALSHNDPSGDRRTNQK